MADKIFVNLYLIGVLSAYLVRIPSVSLNARTSSKRDRLSQAQRMKQEGYLVSFLMMFWFAAALVLPLLHAFTDWFAKLNYSLPAWCGYAGCALFVLLLLILGRAHMDLSRNWSAVVQIKEKQQLVTNGIYHFIRHPIYTAHLLWGLAQALMVNNWLAGFAGFAAVVSIMVLRIPREESLLVEQFGEAYERYMAETGALLPRLKK